MVLTLPDIQTRNIVHGGVQPGQRHTTYDATVGDIILCGKIIDEKKFTLKPRGVVWVVSNEEFHIPNDITGLATLRTTWTHDGVLALNVGILDPGWEGPVATALVNFGNADFVVEKGTQFFRILFLESKATGGTPIRKMRAEYVKEIVAKSRLFSDTFLNMTSLAKDVEGMVLKLPKWAYILTGIALVVSMLAIYMPISFTVWTDHRKEQATLDMLERKVQLLETEIQELNKKREQAPQAQGQQQVQPAQTVK